MKKKMTAYQFMRKVDNYITPHIMIPLLIITVTGVILMFKKQSDWIQPPTQKGVGKTPTVFFEEMLDTLRTVDGAEVASWKDIDRIDVRPSKGVAKVQLDNLLEVQLDLQTGDVLQVMKRRSDVIEDLHVGGYWGDGVKFGVFLLSAVGLLIQLLTGVYIFLKMLNSKLRSRAKKMEKNIPAEELRI